MSDQAMYDLLIIGGGVNGAGIARDAAGRGLKVLLCEKDDLASHTSSASTKLIHGGLRYLEKYDFPLVRKALIERETLLRAAPHIIWPLRFVLPVHKDMRPAWLIRLGLFIYDHLGGREILPPTKTLRRGASDAFEPLKPALTKAFEYSDCWVDDARLVVLNAVAAEERGATIMTRSECVALERRGGEWRATLRVDGQSDMDVEARAVVNAAGPWVDEIVNRAGSGRNAASVRLVKGSHILVPSLFEGEDAYFFQHGDGRIVFAIPYENNQFTMIGTTDEAYAGDPGQVAASDDEVAYLCEIANTYFDRQITPDDVTATFSGVRPLFDDAAADASSVTRDYVLTRDEGEGASLVSVFGGKITTYRKLAEDVLDLLSPDFPEMGRPWTRLEPLPGGDIPDADFDAFLLGCAHRYEWMAPELLLRLARLYGTRIDMLLSGVEDVAGLGRHYGGGLHQKEIDYLIEHEFARSAEDILKRRTKLGLVLTEDQKIAIGAQFKDRLAA